MATTTHTDGRDCGAIVLVYHRIGPSGSDPLGLNVTPEHLAEHVEVLGSGRYQPVSLAQLVHALLEGAIPPNAIALTFDDGYRGVLTEAKPLLERTGIPATAFVPSGFVGNQREFWWEELDELILGASGMPRQRSWRERKTMLAARVRRRDPSRQLYGWHFRRLRVLEPAERRSALGELGTNLPLRRPLRQARLPLSAEELCELGEGELVSIGAHTITHPVLSLLPLGAQEREIAGSKVELEELLGSPVGSFAYPYGGPGEYDRSAVAAVRRAGFDFACANVPGLVRPGTDVFQIPRFVVHDCGGEMFERRLEDWISGRELERRRRLVPRDVAG